MKDLGGSVPRRPRLRNLSLKTRILLPFILIQILLGAAAIGGSAILIRQTLLNTVDERLSAFEAVVVREIKKQEFALETFARIIAYQETVDQNLSPEGQILRGDLYAALGDADISVVYYPANFAELPFPTLRELFADAVASGKPRFRFDAGAGQGPSLCAAMPIVTGGKLEKVLLLQTPIDRTLLKRLGAPFKIETHLLAIDGSLLTGSNQTHRPPQLSEHELTALLSGTHLYKTSAVPQHRQRLCAIPLGTSDIILLNSELPIDFLSLIINNLATRSGAFIGLLLVVGSFVYFNIVRHILAPLKEMRRVAGAIADGDLQRRLTLNETSELGQFAVTFNHMLDQLQSQQNARIAAEHHATVTSDEARFHGLLEEKELELAETNRELKARIHELTALFQINQAMVTTFDLQIVFERTLNALKEATLAREMVLFLYDAGNESLEVRKALGCDPVQMKGQALSVSEGAIGLAARTGEMQYVRDVSRDGNYVDCKGRVNPVGSVVIMPLCFKSELLGVVNLHKDRPNAFTDTDLKLIQAAGNQLAMAIENNRLHEMTRALANNDELTGLANRRYFHEILKRELAQAGRFQSSFCLVMADIDDFQRFNDSFGRLNGDVALRRIATLLLQHTRGIDLVARFGGEEFMILLSKTDKTGAVVAAEKLRQCVAEENFPTSGVADSFARLSLSLGVVEYPSDSRDIYELLDLAEYALLRAKEDGHDRVCACTPELLRSRPTPPAAKD